MISFFLDTLITWMISTPKGTSPFAVAIMLELDTFSKYPMKIMNTIINNKPDFRFT